MFKRFAKKAAPLLVASLAGLAVGNQVDLVPWVELIAETVLTK